MPIPSSGAISLNDINDALPGRNDEQELSMDDAAILLNNRVPTANLTRPHGMDEFYGLSFTIPAQAFSVNAANFGIFPTVYSPSQDSVTAVWVQANGDWELTAPSWITLGTYSGGDTSDDVAFGAFAIGFVGTRSVDVVISQQEFDAPARSGYITIQSSDGDTTPQGSGLNTELLITQQARIPYMRLLLYDTSSGGFFNFDFSYLLDISAAAGSRSLKIEADPGIQWTLSIPNNLDWVTPPAGSVNVNNQFQLQGQGNASNIEYSWEANYTGENRDFDVTLDNTNHTLQSVVYNFEQESTFPFDCTVAGASGFAVDDQGNITPPTVQLGTIQSITYTDISGNQYTNSFPIVENNAYGALRNATIVIIPPAGYAVPTFDGQTPPSTLICYLQVTQPEYINPLDEFFFTDWTGLAFVNDAGTVLYYHLPQLDEYEDITYVNPTQFEVVYTSGITRNVTFSIRVPSGYSNVGQILTGVRTLPQNQQYLSEFKEADWTAVMTVTPLGQYTVTVGNEVSRTQLYTPSWVGEVVNVATERFTGWSLIVPSGYTNAGQTVFFTRSAIQQPISTKVYYDGVDGNNQSYSDTSLSYLGDYLKIGGYSYSGTVGNSISVPFKVTIIQGWNFANVAYIANYQTSGAADSDTLTRNTTQGTGNSAASIYLNIIPNGGGAERNIQAYIYFNNLQKHIVSITQEANPSGGNGGGGLEPLDPNCVLKGTKIKMADGSYKKVENVVVGDLLSSKLIDGLPIKNEEDANLWRESNLQLSDDVVTVVYNQRFDIPKIYSINNNFLSISGDHRHLIKRDGEWRFIAGSSIIVGDIMLNQYEEEIDVYFIEELEGDYTVYRLDVEDNDLYFANGLLTHNAIKLGFD